MKEVAVPGVKVKKGQKIGSLVVDPDGGLAEPDDTAGTVEKSQYSLATQSRFDLLAPHDGEVFLSGATVVIKRSGLGVTGALTPSQALRFKWAKPTGQVTVQTTTGETKTHCETVSVDVGDASANAARSNDDNSGAAGGATADPQPEAASEDTLSVVCRLPDGTDTITGIAAELRLVVEVPGKVLSVTNKAVATSKNGKDYVVTVRRDGREQEIPVVVGISDGVRRVVLHGLQPGDVIVNE